MKDISQEAAVLWILYDNGRKLTNRQIHKLMNIVEQEKMSGILNNLIKKKMVINTGKHACDKCYAPMSVYKITPLGVKFLAGIKHIWDKVEKQTDVEVD